MILYPESMTTAGLFKWILSAGGNLSNNASSWALFIPDSRLERASLYRMMSMSNLTGLKHHGQMTRCMTWVVSLTRVLIGVGHKQSQLTA